jgi:hypothetical protein
MPSGRKTLFLEHRGPVDEVTGVGIEHGSGGEPASAVWAAAISQVALRSKRTTNLLYDGRL